LLLDGLVKIRHSAQISFSFSNIKDTYPRFSKTKAPAEGAR
jgi:hypothetical protein